MDDYTLYLILLVVLALLLFCGKLLKKLFKKADIDISDEQFDAITKAVSDAVAEIEETNKKLVAAGGKPMSSEEKTEVTVKLAKDLAMAAGISAIKTDFLLKLLDTASKEIKD